MTMKTLTWGLIGCGDISRKRVAPALRDLPTCTFLGVARKQADKAKAFAAQFGARRWYPAWEKLIADREIEAVYVATPTDLHCEQAVAAAEAGKHVLCEKPMGMTVAECDRMIAACRANGVSLGVAYYRHFYPVVARMKALIADGAVGRIVTAHINAYERFNPSPGEDRYWFMLREHAGGGPMFDFGCHRIEVLLNVLGPVTEVTGFIDTVVFEREVDDTGTAFLRFGSGAHGMLSVTHAAIEPQDTFSVFGTEGSLHVDVLNAGTLRIVGPDGVKTENHPPHENIHLPLIDDFTNSVLDGREPGVGGETGREVNRIEAMIYGR